MNAAGRKLETNAVAQYTAAYSSALMSSFMILQQAQPMFLAYTPHRQETHAIIGAHWYAASEVSTPVMHTHDPEAVERDLAASAKGGLARM